MYVHLQYQPDVLETDSRIDTMVNQQQTPRSGSVLPVLLALFVSMYCTGKRHSSGYAHASDVRAGAGNIFENGSISFGDHEANIQVNPDGEVQKEKKRIPRVGPQHAQTKMQMKGDEKKVMSYEQEEEFHHMCGMITDNKN